MNNIESTTEQIKIEDTKRYQYLMEESMRSYPSACMLLVQCVVCEEIMGEMGITIDDNDTEKMKNIYCNKLEYENMISCTKLEDDLY
jgi:hypothetical protein